MFGEATGLKTNLAKCSITPILSADDTFDQIVAIMGCQVHHFPIRYLGLPLTTKRVPKVEFHSLVEAVARKMPPCHGSLMARSGRLIWIESVLQAVPIYSMMADSLPPWARKQIDSIYRRFLWVGKDGLVHGKSMVTWATACRPTELGDLGLLTSSLSASHYKQDGFGFKGRTSCMLGANSPLELIPKCKHFSGHQLSRCSAMGGGHYSGMIASFRDVHLQIWRQTLCRLFLDASDRA